MSQFRAHAAFELPNLEFRKTKDEAVADAMERLKGSLEYGKLPNIIVQEVIEPKLSDFFSSTDMVSAMRERMQGAIGNDDALSDPDTMLRIIHEAEPKINEALDAIDIRIDGYLVVNTWTVKDWAPENGEA